MRKQPPRQKATGNNDLAAPSPSGKKGRRGGLRRRPTQQASLTSKHLLLVLGAAVLVYAALALSHHYRHSSSGGGGGTGDNGNFGGGPAVEAEVVALVDAGRKLIESVALADALAVFRRAHALAPQNPICGLYFARMLLANRKYREAATRFDATLTCCAPRGEVQIAKAQATGNQEALQVTTDLLYGLGKAMRYADEYDYGEQRAALHAEFELLGTGVADRLLAQLEAEVAEEEEAQRQTLEMERMEREFLKDEE